MRTRNVRRRCSGILRALWLCIIVLAFGGSAMLLTCQRHIPVSHVQPSTSKSTGARPVSDQPTHSKENPVTTDTAESQDSDSHPQDEPSAPTEPAKSPNREVIPRPPSTGTSVHRPVGEFEEVSRGDPQSPEIALTFDSGWEYKPTPKILDTLAKYRIHSTFFVTGQWASKHSDLVRRMVAEGHEVGNHTYSHKRLTELNAGEIASEAGKTEQLLQKLTGRSTKPLLRVPYGARDNRVLTVLEQEGYRSVYWDVDSWDAFKADITPAEVEQRVLGRVRSGSIVLMHCGSGATADALDSIIRKLLAAGYKPVTVSELLSD